jgi:hypothetical protein
MDGCRNRSRLVSQRQSHLPPEKRCRSYMLTHSNSVAGTEGWFLYRTSWEQAVEAAKHRNAAG